MPYPLSESARIFLQMQASRTRSSAAGPRPKGRGPARGSSRRPSAQRMPRPFLALAYQFQWSVLWTNPYLGWLLWGVLTTLALTVAGVDPGRGARRLLRRRSDRALASPPGRGDGLRRVLPERAPPRVDVPLVLRRAGASPGGGPGLAEPAPRRVHRRGRGPRRLSRGPHGRDRPRRHPVGSGHAHGGGPVDGPHARSGVPPRRAADRPPAHRAPASPTTRSTSSRTRPSP